MLLLIFDVLIVELILSVNDMYKFYSHMLTAVTHVLNSRFRCFEIGTNELPKFRAVF